MSLDHTSAPFTGGSKSTPRAGRRACRELVAHDRAQHRMKLLPIPDLHKNFTPNRCALDTWWVLFAGPRTARSPAGRMVEMKVDIYVSERDNIPSYGFLSAGRSVSVLPPGEQWRFVRSGDSADFNL